VKDRRGHGLVLANIISLQKNIKSISSSYVNKLTDVGLAT
jgi:hypothetical protein